MRGSYFFYIERSAGAVAVNYFHKSVLEKDEELLVYSNFLNLFKAGLLSGIFSA